MTGFPASPWLYTPDHKIALRWLLSYSPRRSKTHISAHALGRRCSLAELLESIGDSLQEGREHCLLLAQCRDFKDDTMADRIQAYISLLDVEIEHDRRMRGLHV